MKHNIPERSADSYQRHLPPAETFVLVGQCKNIDHLQWILREKIYNCSIKSGLKSLELSPEMAAAKYLLLHFESGRTISGLMRITSKGPLFLSRDALLLKGYPGTLSQELYLFYNVEPAIEFNGINWDYSRLEELLHHRESDFPFPIPLDAVLETAIVQS